MLGLVDYDNESDEEDDYDKLLHVNIKDIVIKERNVSNKRIKIIAPKLDNSIDDDIETINTKDITLKYKSETSICKLLSILPEPSHKFSKNLYQSNKPQFSKNAHKDTNVLQKKLNKVKDDVKFEEDNLNTKFIPNILYNNEKISSNEGKSSPISFFFDDEQDNININKDISKDTEPHNIIHIYDDKDLIHIEPVIDTIQSTISENNQTIEFDPEIEMSKFIPKNERNKMVNVIHKCGPNKSLSHSNMETNLNLIEANADQILGYDRVEINLNKNITIDDQKWDSKKAKSEIDSLQRKKHQITYLALQAKEKEFELQNQWAAGRIARKESRSRYGF
ncbi:unnamed protein product [Gordionus sp. m RMFG-2023]|uniref:MATH and LRR domain-containing protein PFE0570w-like isoform X4 n=1 Tax=Gordionus sp. m RMFG-2023 TaxID=3053472 RepID=UPI0030E28098